MENGSKLNPLKEFKINNINNNENSFEDEWNKVESVIQQCPISSKTNSITTNKYEENINNKNGNVNTLNIINNTNNTDNRYKDYSDLLKLTKENNIDNIESETNNYELLTYKNPEIKFDFKYIIHSIDSSIFNYFKEKIIELEEIKDIFSEHEKISEEKNDNNKGINNFNVPPEYVENEVILKQNENISIKNNLCNIGNNNTKARINIIKNNIDNSNKEKKTFLKDLEGGNNQEENENKETQLRIQKKMNLLEEALNTNNEKTLMEYDVIKKEKPPENVNKYKKKFKDINRILDIKNEDNIVFKKFINKKPYEFNNEDTINNNANSNVDNLNYVNNQYSKTLENPILEQRQKNLPDEFYQTGILPKNDNKNFYVNMKNYPNKDDKEDFTGTSSVSKKLKYNQNLLDNLFKSKI